MIKEKRPYYFWYEGVSESAILAVSGAFFLVALPFAITKQFSGFMVFTVLSIVNAAAWAICGNLMERYNRNQQNQEPEITKDLEQVSEKPEKVEKEIINNRTAMTDEQLDLVEKNRDAIKSLIRDLKDINGHEYVRVETGHKSGSDNMYGLDMIDGYTYSNTKIKELLIDRVKHAISREIVLVIIELVNDVKEIYPEWQITDPELKRLIDENRAQIPKDKEHLDGILGVLERYSQG